MKIHTLLALPILAAAAAAQTPAPAPELAPFESWVGHWAGKGIANGSAEGPAFAYNARIDFRPILSGHFYQEDFVVTVGEGEQEALFFEMRTIHGWDAENKSYVHANINNQGIASIAPAYWSGTTLVSSDSYIEAAKRIATTRTVKSVVDGSWQFAMYRSIEGAPEYTHVEATLARVSDDPEVVDFTELEIKPVNTTDLLQSLIGDYEISGEMIPVPGAEPILFSGTESIVPILRGHVFEFTTAGQPGDYEALTLILENRVKGGSHYLSFDNMGTFVNAECHPVDGAMVITHTGSQMGLPYAERAVLEVGEHGPTRFTTHRFCGTRGGEKVFEATYAKVEAEEAE